MPVHLALMIEELIYISVRLIDTVRSPVCAVSKCLMWEEMILGGPLTMISTLAQFDACGFVSCINLKTSQAISEDVNLRLAVTRERLFGRGAVRGGWIECLVSFDLLGNCKKMFLNASEIQLIIFPHILYLNL